jgi:hypothetical protein
VSAATMQERQLIKAKQTLKYVDKDELYFMQSLKLKINERFKNLTKSYERFYQ